MKTIYHLNPAKIMLDNEAEPCELMSETVLLDGDVSIILGLFNIFQSSN